MAASGGVAEEAESVEHGERESGEPDQGAPGPGPEASDSARREGVSHSESQKGHAGCSENSLSVISIHL